MIQHQFDDQIPPASNHGLPAMNPGERFGFLSAMKQNMPAEVFAIAAQVARQALGESNWLEIEHKLAAI